MSLWRLIGVALLILGLWLLYTGWQATDAFDEQVREMVTGQFSDETVWQLVGGAAAAVAGLLMTVFGGRNR